MLDQTRSKTDVVGAKATTTLFRIIKIMEYDISMKMYLSTLSRKRIKSNPMYFKKFDTT
ncbi:hypothetical protein [Dokdonia pacifica]|uniref:hypothetical protein n=1 Tax=Dokdonia pacifica TaxID=1627892 RepID=UPI0015C69535|nr:hypothetical protein [Dokdonia pacifica]